MTLEEIKVKAIAETLERNEGNRAWTARDLGISVRTVRNYIRKYKLPPAPRFLQQARQAVTTAGQDARKAQDGPPS